MRKGNGFPIKFSPCSFANSGNTAISSSNSDNKICFCLNTVLDLNEFEQENHICVSTELLDYKPIELLELLKKE